MKMVFKKEEVFSLPYSYEDAFNAILAICKKFGWKIEYADKKHGFIKAISGLSALSWGEIIHITLSRVDIITTRVYAISESKGGDVLSIIKNYINIKNLFKELQKVKHYISDQEDV